MRDDGVPIEKLRLLNNGKKSNGKHSYLKDIQQLGVRYHFEGTLSTGNPQGNKVSQTFMGVLAEDTEGVQWPRTPGPVQAGLDMLFQVVG